MKKIVSVILLFFYSLSFVFASGLPVYDGSNFLNQLLQLSDSGKQLTNTIEQVKMMYDEAERIYKSFEETYESGDGSVYTLVNSSLSAGSTALKDSVGILEKFGVKIDQKEKEWIATTDNILERAISNISRYTIDWDDRGSYPLTAIDNTFCDFLNTCEDIKSNFQEHYNNIITEYEEELAELEEEKKKIVDKATKALSENTKADEAVTTNTNEQKQFLSLDLTFKLYEENKKRCENAKLSCLKHFFNAWDEYSTQQYLTAMNLNQMKEAAIAEGKHNNFMNFKF